MYTDTPKRRGGNARNQRTSFPHVEARRTRAAERVAAGAQRTPEQQLERLDKMFGPGQGARKERAKLVARIRARQDAELAAAAATVVKAGPGRKAKKQARKAAQA